MILDVLEHDRRIVIGCLEFHKNPAHLCGVLRVLRMLRHLSSPGVLQGYTGRAVAVQTIHFADQPNLFGYKRGAKVVQRGADGYADPDWAGVVVDGAWRGNPSGGPYTATYRIKRDRGDYFEADELALLTRFDTDADLRDEIREKIRTYALPRSMPPARGVDRKEPARQPQEVSTCSACSHQIRPREPGSMEYEYSPGQFRFRFHSRCNAIWREEVRRRLVPPSRL